MAARRLKQLYSRYERSRDLISVGAYAAGSDPVLDQAIALHDKIEAFLCQEIHENVGMLRELGPTYLSVRADRRLRRPPII